MLTFYDYAKAPSPRRARIFMAEKAIDYQCVQIDLARGEQLSADYKAINARCSVPALKTEDGTIITENVAIATYIEAIKPEPALMGQTPLEKARILEWNWRCEFEGLMAIAEILRNTSDVMKNRALPGPHNYPQIPQLAERGYQRIQHFYAMLNAHLLQQDYVALDQFTFADITAFVTVDFAKWVKASPDDSFTALHQWYVRVAERPSAQA